MHMLLVIVAFTFCAVTPFMSAPSRDENQADFSDNSGDEAPSDLAEAGPEDEDDLA